MYREHTDTHETPAGVPVQNALARLVEDDVITDESWMISRLCPVPCLLPGDLDRHMARFQEILRWGQHVKIVGQCAILRHERFGTRIAEGLAYFRNDPRDERQSVKVLSGVSVSTVGLYRNWFEEDCMTRYLTYFHEYQPWQLQDVDTAREWEFAELVAEHYILKGRDMVDVYEDRA